MIKQNFYGVLKVSVYFDICFYENIGKVFKILFGNLEFIFINLKIYSNLFLGNF